MKGIILSGGLGTRLAPLTDAVSKQLLPVYNKPMIYYPLSTLLLSGIKKVLLITTQEALSLYRKALGDGSRFGIKLFYEVQEEPKGIAEAFLIGEDFIKEETVALILGDNLFYGAGLGKLLHKKAQTHEGARIFSYRVKNPEAYGVICENELGEPFKIVEKPKEKISDLAVTGLYFYDKKVLEYAKSLKPSARGELEITDINNLYLENKALRVTRLSEGTAWLDMGTPEALLQASNFIYTLEERQGFKVGWPVLF